MSAIVDTQAAAVGLSTSIFSRALVGIDGSDASVAAAVQAASLLEPAGELALFSAYSSEPTLVGGLGWAAPTYLDEDADRETATKRLDAVRVQLPSDVSVETRTARGRAGHELLREADRSNASLVAVGSHGRGQVLGALLGSTATAIIHLAPCSVLVARATPPPFPGEIVVGADGSSQSLAATQVALALAKRHGARVHALAATGDDPVDADGLAQIGRLLEAAQDDFIPPHDVASLVRWSRETPVEALVDASANADLLVVGSRGLRRLAVLGSVSRRIAHRAHCSVLIVRETNVGHGELEAPTADPDDDAGR
jgi:nucleotide-binding universal stress UspA family protein